MSSNPLEQLTHRVLSGDDRPLGEIFAALRPRLLQAVRLRMDHRLYGRIDPDDIVQEAFLVASRRLAEFRSRVTVSLFVWLRTITLQALADAGRFHLVAKSRDPDREVRLAGDSRSTAGGCALPGNLTTPTRAILRAEVAGQVQSLLEKMSEVDREILVLRHFEELSNQEAAEVLGLHKAAATNRYVRALRRLRQALSLLPEWQEQAGR